MSYAYVYAITINGVPRYIGKGTGNRALLHFARVRALIKDTPSAQRWHRHHLYAAMAKAARAGIPIGYQIVADGLSEDQAYALEAEIIATTSGLLNKAAGGRGGTTLSTAASWADPAVREARIAGMRRTNATLWLGREDETHQRAAKGWQRQGRAETQGSAMRERWQDEAYRARAIGGMMKRPKRDISFTQTDDAREKRKGSLKSSWANMTIEARDARRAAMREGRRKARDARNVRQDQP